jgi:hypothetical protein
MMPPMIPPMAGGAGSDKERERQTWLSEDDKIWGTDPGAGSGVIGLPSDAAQEADEPLAPTHVHMRSANARGRATEHAADETAETAKPTASG